MYIYQSESGQWILFDGTTKHYFSTQLEAAKMARKLEFATAVRAKVTELDNLISYLGELRDIFQDSGYDGDGSDPITDEDLESLGMTAGDMAAFNMFVENIKLFYHNGIPAQIDYAAAVNRFRSM